VVTVMIVLAGLIVMLLVECRVVIAMTDRVRLIVIRVRLVVTVMIVLVGLIATRVPRVVIAMTGRVRLIVMLLVERRVVIATTDHVRLIVIRVRLVVTVMIVHVGLIVTLVRLALLRKNVLTKSKVVLASAALVVKCHCHQSVLVKIG
jgi:hypothetical protein